MGTYNNILVAVDISNEAEIVLAKAIELASKFDAKITLVHIVEPVVIETSYDLTPALNIDIEENLTKRAENFLSQLAEELQLGDIKSIVSVGATKHEIHQLCEEGNIDLVIIGTHGRHGVSLLLGSTANAILHGTPCDVLSVKI